MNKDERSILFIFAHPDDETFTCAGTACRYATEGVRLALVSATRGEAGTCGQPPICSREELPAVREGELRRAAEIIGIGELYFLDYKDKELADAPVEEVRRALVRIIRQVRPTIVITFDPEGLNLHPDHIAISRFTSDAVAAAADPRWFPEAGDAHEVERLLWTTPKRLDEVAALDNPGREAGVDYILDVSRWRQAKADALRAHRTQQESINKIFFEIPNSEAVLSLEVYRQAWNPRSKRLPFGDLFAEL